MDMSFILFDIIFLLRSDSLLLKSVFFTKFACTVLVLNASVANLLNSVVVIYLFSIFLILMSQSLFQTRLLTSGILFSIVVNAAFVARLLTSGILFSTVDKAIFVAKLLIRGILFSTVANAVFDARPLISGILFSSSVLSASQ